MKSQINLDKKMFSFGWDLHSIALVSLHTVNQPTKLGCF